MVGFLIYTETLCRSVSHSFLDPYTDIKLCRSTGEKIRLIERPSAVQGSLLLAGAGVQVITDNRDIRIKISGQLMKRSTKSKIFPPSKIG